MLDKFLTKNVEQTHMPREGDLYKEVTISGKTFKLLYGYYESFERESPFNEPMPIYPDFIKEPHYTDEGIPIATAMQNVCQFFNGTSNEDSSCADCAFFQNHEELFGFCYCPQNKVSFKKRANVQNE